MEIFKTSTEDPQAAYDRVCEQLLDVGDRALGPGATNRDIKDYNRLCAQRFEHRDGTRGHLHLEKKTVIFDTGLVVLGHPVRLVWQRSEKIPYKLKPGTNTVIFK